MNKLYVKRVVLPAAVLLMPLLFAACPKNEPPPRPRASVSTNPRQPSVTPPIVAVFNGERAMDHVRKQIDFGPRPPDTPQLAKTRAYITRELKSSGLNVYLDEFTAVTPQGDKKMANIIGEIPGETKTLILITSHYDTKYYKDMQFLGANDPGSSVATLLEIGRVLGSKKEKPKVTYRLVFFDGEEATCEGWDECGSSEKPDNTYGSRSDDPARYDRIPESRIGPRCVEHAMVAGHNLGNRTRTRTWKSFCRPR
jgi:hypothetical protein